MVSAHWMRQRVNFKVYAYIKKYTQEDIYIACMRERELVYLFNGKSRTDGKIPKFDLFVNLEL